MTIPVLNLRLRRASNFGPQSFNRTYGMGMREARLEIYSLKW
jgi:hypothetical protein